MVTNQSVRLVYLLFNLSEIFHTMKLSIRVLIFLAISQALLIAATFFIVLKKTQSVLRTNFAKDTEQIACALGVGIEDLESSAGQKSAESRLKSFYNQYGLAYASLANSRTDKKIVWGDQSLAAQIDKEGVRYNPADYKIFVTYCEGAANPNIEVSVARSYDEILVAESGITTSFSMTFVAEVALLFALAVGLSLFVHKRTEPIFQICREYGHGNLHARVPVKGSDEFSEIAKRINAMINDLETLRTNEAETTKIQVSKSKLMALGEMASGVAHEINTPLAIISARTTLIMRIAKNLSPEIFERIKKEVDVIVEVVERISKIIKGLRAISRDGSTDPFQLVSVSSILDDTRHLIQEKLKLSGIKFELDCQEGIFVNGRATELSQVALNLASNSFHAVKGRTDAWIKILARENNGFVEISFSDNGAGIPPENSEKIMQPFFTTKPVGEGTGLGLSVSIGIARAHHGELLLIHHQEPTTFLLKLPKANAIKHAKAA